MSNIENNLTFNFVTPFIRNQYKFSYSVYLVMAHKSISEI